MTGHGIGDVSLAAVLVGLGTDPDNPRCPRCRWPLQVSEAPTWSMDPAAGVSLRCMGTGCRLGEWDWCDRFAADALEIDLDEARHLLRYADEALRRARGAA